MFIEYVLCFHLSALVNLVLKSDIAANEVNHVFYVHVI